MFTLKRPFLPAYRYGIAIDLIAIVANLVLFPFVLSRVGGLFQSSFSVNSKTFITLAGLMVLILAARFCGLYLKRFPLQTRLEASGQTSFPMYFFILNIGVLVLNAAFAMVFLSALAAHLGLVETNYAGQPKDSPALMFVGVTVMLAMTATEIYLLYRLGVPLTEAETERRQHGDWRFGWKGEFAADFGLFAYMMVWQVFYNDTARMMMSPSPNGADTLEYKIFSAIFVFIIFLLFYLSPRTVFLIEDRKYLGTWAFIFGVYLSSVLGVR